MSEEHRQTDPGQHREIPIPPAGEWGWTGELPAAAIRTLAPVGLELWRRGSDWVNRRVETVELLDVDTVRLHLSIDFRIPTALPGAEDLAKKTYFLPLTVLQRRTNLAYFDLRDEAGTAVPMLTRQENARLTGAVLVAAARLALRGHDDLELDAALIAYLATIPTKTPAESRVFVRSVLDPNNSLLYPDRRLAETLLSDPEFRDLLGLCAFCSFIHVPVTAKAGERRIIKVSCLTPWPSSMPRTSRTESENRLQRLQRRLLAWLGWRPEARYLFLPHIGNAESFHLQIEAPPRIEFTAAGLTNGRPADLVLQDASSVGSMPLPDPPEGSGETKSPQPFVPGISRRKHLYLELSHAHRTGFAWVSFRVVRHGFLRAALTVAWLMTALLALFATRADNILGEAQTAAALLLLVPALIAGFLIAPGEHPMTRHLLRGPRLLTATTGFLALFATASMLTMPDPHSQSAPCALVWIWAVESVLSGVLAVLLTIGAFLPKAPDSIHAEPPTEHQEPFIGPPTEEQAEEAGNV